MKTGKFEISVLTSLISVDMIKKIEIFLYELIDQAML